MKILVTKTSIVATRKVHRTLPFGLVIILALVVFGSAGYAAIAPILPTLDLAVSGPASPITGEYGEEFSVDIQVKNIGTKLASAPSLQFIKQLTVFRRIEIPSLPGRSFPCTDSATAVVCQKLPDIPTKQTLIIRLYGAFPTRDAPGVPGCGGRLVPKIDVRVQGERMYANNTYTANLTLNCALCPNGVVDPGEECDDGNQINTDDCPNDCLLPVCGDGRVEGREECDDGNTANGDGCTSACLLCEPVIDPVCAEGTLIPQDLDQRGCLQPSTCCGNNVCEGKETTQNCSFDCGQRCGNGRVEAPEECDDGNTIENDGCTNLCRIVRCGDGVVQPPEECDDGNTVNDDVCTNTCRAPRCGDGILQTGEECDDGNTEDGDACSSQCTVTDPRCAACPYSCDQGICRTYDEHVWSILDRDGDGELARWEGTEVLRLLIAAFGTTADSIDMNGDGYINEEDVSIAADAIFWFTEEVFP